MLLLWNWNLPLLIILGGETLIESNEGIDFLAGPLTGGLLFSASLYVRRGREGREGAGGEGLDGVGAGFGAGFGAGGVVSLSRLQDKYSRDLVTTWLCNSFALISSEDMS